MKMKERLFDFVDDWWPAIASAVLVGGVLAAVLWGLDDKAKAHRTRLDVCHGECLPHPATGWNDYGCICDTTKTVLPR